MENVDANIENADDMEALLWSHGCDVETAKFVARMLKQSGYQLISTDRKAVDAAIAAAFGKQKSRTPCIAPNSRQR